MEPRKKLPYMEMPATCLREDYEPTLRLFAI